jgi:hypothetical protein
MIDRNEVYLDIGDYVIANAGYEGKEYIFQLYKFNPWKDGGHFKVIGVPYLSLDNPKNSFTFSKSSVAKISEQDAFHFLLTREKDFGCITDK